MLYHIKKGATFIAHSPILKHFIHCKRLKEEKNKRYIKVIIRILIFLLPKFYYFFLKHINQLTIISHFNMICSREVQGMNTTNTSLNRKDKYKPLKRTREEIEYLLTYTHKTRIKEICKMLKCSRPFVNDNIIHYFDDPEDFVFVYDNRLVNPTLANDATLNGKWYDTEKIEQFIRDAIVEVSVQTITVDASYFIKTQELANEWAEKYDRLMDDYHDDDTFENKGDKALYYDQLFENLNDQYFDLDECEDMIAKYNKRGDAQSIDITSDELINQIDLYNLVSVPSLKDYGDVDEEVYRKLFKESYYKVTFQFTNFKTGEIGKKVLYTKIKSNNTSNMRYPILLKYQYFDAGKVKNML